MAGEKSAFAVDPSWPTMLELASRLWGEPTDHSHDHNEYRFGEKQSKSIRVKEAVWKDHEADTGGGYVGMWKMVHPGQPLPPRTDVPKPNGHAASNGQHKGPPPWEDIAVTYPYRDAKGALVLEVVRTISKKPRFRQRRPNGTLWNGETKWAWKVNDLPGHDCILYRLPELLASNGTVFIVEGEKDADNLAALGLTVTTGIGGSGKWRAEYADFFQDRDVVVLPDFDPVGIKHAETVARSLAVVAHSLKVVMLPGLAEKGDVSDWLAAGGNRAALEHLALEAPFWVPPDVFDDPPAQPAEDETPPDAWDTDDGPPGEEPPLPPAPPPAGLPPNQPPQINSIICEEGEIVRMVREAEAHLANAPGLPVYQRGMLVQPWQNEYRDASGNVVHSAGFATMTSTALMKLLARSANYLKWDGRLNGGQGAYKRINPPDKLVETVLFDRVDWPFETVRGVLSCPTMRPDGSILRESGYDPATRYYLMFPSDLIVPDIPEAPTKNDARAALIRLLKLLDSYPFVNKASQAVALCILMTQVLRCAMPVSPMMAVSAKAPGTGKSHLVDLGSTVATGRTCPSMGAGSDKKETEKEIAAMLLSGVSGFTIDNVSSDIDLPLLNRATSQENLTIRVFGKLENVEVQNSGVVYMTGNNLAIVDEQRRRTVRCEMDIGLENPERRAFEGDPIQTVLADRGRYVADVLTIARAYHASGASVAPYPFNGYEAWSHFVREPLIWLGQADACDSMDGTAKDDPATIRLHAMVEGWWKEFEDRPRTAAQAVVDAEQNGFYQTLREQFPSKGGSEVDTTRMGYWLRKFSGRVANGKRFVRDDGTTGGVVRWKVECV